MNLILFVIFISMWVFTLVLQGLNVYTSKMHYYTVKQALQTVMIGAVVISLYLEMINVIALLGLFLSGLLLLTLIQNKNIKKSIKFFFMNLLENTVIIGLILGILLGFTYIDSTAFLIGLGLVIPVMFMGFYRFLIPYFLEKYLIKIPYSMPLDTSAISKNHQTFLPYIYVVKGKKISLPMNALFTGFFKNKRILLSLSLVKRVNSRGLKSIILHEFGHQVNKHLWIRLALLIGLYIIYFIVFSLTFNYQGLSSQLFFLISSVFILNKTLGIIIYRIMQIQEYQADEYVKSKRHQVALINALMQITKTEREIKFYPLYHFLYVSHPPVQKRLKKLKNN